MTDAAPSSTARPTQAAGATGRSPRHVHLRRPVVASRRHLPGLRPELRRRQRRRHRRPGRRAGAIAVPGGPGSRRHLVHALVRVAARRWRLRRRRLPGHRPGLRVARRGRAADLRGPRPGHPDHRRHRPEPRLRPAPLVPGGPGCRARLAGAGQVLVPARRGQERRRDAERLEVQLLGPHLDPNHQPRRHSRRVVPPPLLAGAAGPELEPPRRPSRARGSPQVLVRPRRRRRPDRLGRPARQGSEPARSPGRAEARRAPQHRS